MKMESRSPSPIPQQMALRFGSEVSKRALKLLWLKTLPTYKMRIISMLLSSGVPVDEENKVPQRGVSVLLMFLSLCTLPLPASSK